MTTQPTSERRLLVPTLGEAGGRRSQPRLLAMSCVAAISALMAGSGRRNGQYLHLGPPA